MSSLNDLPLVDSHLDLAEIVTLFGRDLTLSVTPQGLELLGQMAELGFIWDISYLAKRVYGSSIRITPRRAETWRRRCGRFWRASGLQNYKPCHRRHSE